jgi:hypothetical protein
VVVVTFYRAWLLTVVHGTVVAVMSAVIAPAFGNDPEQMGLVGFMVGVAFAPTFFTLQRAIVGRASKP